MTKYLLSDLRTGRRLLTLPVLKGPWNDRLNAAESINVTVPMYDPGVQALNLHSASAVAKTILAVLEGDTVMAMGPIWTSAYDRDKGTLELGAAGMASFYNHRAILPVLAASLGVDQWTIPDPTDPTKTIPNPLLSTTISGVSLGTIAKRLLQQAHQWTGGQLPFVFQDDETDADPDHTRTYLGPDFKPVNEALAQLSQVEGGPEINFQGQLTADRLGLECVLQTGNPLITSPSVLKWSLTAPDTPVSKFRAVNDGTKMGSLAWQTGGRQIDKVLVARAYDPALVDAGYPLMEIVDSSHTTVSEQPTLDRYANASVSNGGRPTSVWSFDVRADVKPLAGSYFVGDFLDLAVAKFDPATRQGDPYVPGNTYRRRIVGLSGDEKGKTLSIDCAAVEAIP